MNLQAVNNILSEIDDSLEGGLMGVDIISKASGMSIAGIRSSPKACALYNRMTESLYEALGSEDSPAKGLKKFFLEGGNGVFIFVVELDDRHRWTMLVDSTAHLGVILGAIIPDVEPRLTKALKAYINS